MLRWAVEFVLERGDYSWSVENVVTFATRTLLTELAAKYPDKVAFGLFESAEFGAPQRRVRMIAGPPKLIRMLQAIPVTRQVSIREAFQRAGREVTATHCKNQTRDRYGVPAVRAIETTSFTVCASHALTWCDAQGKTVRLESDSSEEERAAADVAEAETAEPGAAAEAPADATNNAEDKMAAIRAEDAQPNRPSFLAV